MVDIMIKHNSYVEYAIDQMLCHHRGDDFFVLCPQEDQKLYLNQPCNQFYFASLLAGDCYGVEFSLERWPFREKAFDVIVVHNHLHLVNDLERFMSEISKKLSNKGSVIFLNMQKEHQCEVSQPQMVWTSFKSHKTLLSYGFHKKYAQVFNASFKPANRLMQKLCPWLYSNFIFYYTKSVTPLTPLKFDITSSMLKKTPGYVPASNYEQRTKE